MWYKIWQRSPSRDKKFTLRQPADQSSAKKQRTISTLYFTAHHHVFKENPEEELTVFLDYFLTNENRERDVKNVKYHIIKAHSSHIVFSYNL